MTPAPRERSGLGQASPPTLQVPPKAFCPSAIPTAVSDDVDDAANNIEVTREIIAYVKLHADELRAKGVPVEDMIRDLEEAVAKVVASRDKLRAIRAEDEHLTQKRAHLRREVDRLARLPADLVDGKATIPNLQGAVEREERRKGRGKKGVGG